MKAPTKKLTPEARKKIAKALVPDGQSYDAEYWSEDWKALVCKLAQAIKAEAEKGLSYHDEVDYWLRMGEALAAYNTSALESLFAEMLEEKG